MKLYKKVYIIVLAVCCINLFAGCLSSQSEDEDAQSINLQGNETREASSSKVLIVTGEYTPYVGEKLEEQGFLSVIIKNALKDCNIDYEIEFYPWARCIEMVEKGEAWASYPFGLSEEKDQSFLYSDPVCETVHRFYYRKDNSKVTDEVQDYDSIDDFTDYTFGGAYGYWYGNRNDLTALGVKSEWANDTQALLKMLNAGRIDFIIEDELVFDTVRKELYPNQEDKFIALPKAAKKQMYHLMVSKDYPNSQEMLDQFNDALKHLENNNIR